MKYLSNIIMKPIRIITVRPRRTVSLVDFQDTHGGARDHQNSHGDYVDQ